MDLYSRAPTTDAREFSRVFNRRLHDFWHPVFKFDVVAFDKAIATPESMSCYDFIQRQYGDTALALIARLVGS